MANEFKRMQKLAGIITESQIKENRIGALLNTVADDWGEDSDFYSDLEDSLTGWVDRNGQLTPKGKISIKNLLSNWDLLDDYGHFLDDEEMNEGNEDYYKDAEADDAEHIDALEKDMKDDAKYTSEGKMKMSELKAAIKALAEGEEDLNINDDESLYDPVYEASEFDMNKAARIKEFIVAFNKLVDEYHAELYLNDDWSSAISMVIKAAKEEAMNSKLSEAKKDEEVEDIKDVDVTVGDEETMADVTTAEVDPNVKSVQDALTQAQVAAEKLGDDKLTDQIGNTITFFTRTHIVDKPGMTAESNIKERISKLVKSLNESTTGLNEERYKTDNGKIPKKLIDDLDDNITYQFPSRFKSGETIKRELDPEELVGDSSIEKIWKAIQDLGGKITFKSPKNSLMFKNIDMTFTSTPDGKVQYSVKVP